MQKCTFLLTPAHRSLAAGLKFLTEDKPPSGLFHDLGESRYPVHLQPVRPCTWQYPLLSLILGVAGLQGELNAITGSCQAPVGKRHSLRYRSDFLVPALCLEAEGSLGRGSPLVSIQLVWMVTS